MVGDGGRLDIDGEIEFHIGIKMDSANSQLFITGCNWRGDLDNDAGGTVALYGGRFHSSYKDSWAPYCAPGYEMVQDSSSRDYYKVQPKAGTVAKVADESGYADGGGLSIVKGTAADAEQFAEPVAWNGALAGADAAVRANFAAWCEKYGVADLDALTEADADCFLLGFAPGSEVGEIKTDIELIDGKVKISFTVSAVEPGGEEVIHGSDDLSTFNGVVYVCKAESLDEILEAAGIKFEGQEFDQESPSCFYRIGVDFKLP